MINLIKRYVDPKTSEIFIGIRHGDLKNTYLAASSDDDIHIMRGSSIGKIVKTLINGQTISTCEWIGFQNDINFIELNSPAMKIMFGEKYEND